MTTRYHAVTLACGHSRELPDVENQAFSKRVWCWTCSSLQPRQSTTTVKTSTPGMDRRLS